MTIPTLDTLELKNQRALIRVDFNVPLDDEGNITDDTRIQAALPTIQAVLKKGGACILMSHLGRPKGKKDPKFSLKPVQKRLSEILKQEVILAPDCIGKEVEKLASNLKSGQVLLLENLRFHEAEETPEKDPNFAKLLAKLGSIYINDAFGAAHREHASIAQIAQYFPGKKAMGLLMQKEIDALTPLLENPKRPFYAIIGGAKISSKIGVIRKLIDSVDGLFIGGAMAYTFLKAQRIETGDSMTEDTELVRNLPTEKIYLPKDLVIADSLENEANTKIIPVERGIPKGWQGVDIGPETTKVWSKALKNGKTIFWNGPVGVFEKPNFAHGTENLAQDLAKYKAHTIVGGGDSIAAIQKMGLEGKFAHLSTGGGASLEFLEKGHLPGIDALLKN